MTEIVHVAHPAPLIAVPRGGRHRRVVVARQVTPARLMSLPEDAFAPLVTPDGVTLPGCMRDGAVWMPLGMAERGGARNVTPAELGAFLSDDLPEGDLRASLLSRFRRTPLVAATRWTGRNGFAQDGSERGSPVDPARLVDVASVGREACAESLRAFVETGIAVVGDTILARARPLAVYHQVTEAGHGGHTVSLSANPHSRRWAIPPIGLDRLGTGIEAWRHRWHPIPQRHPALARLVSALPAGHSPDDDLRHMANAWTGDVMEETVPGRGDDPEPYERLAELRSRLVAPMLSSMTGGLGEDGLRESLHAIHDLAAAAIGAGCPRTWALLRMRDHLAGRVLPRLPPPPFADLLALEGLAP